MRVFTTFEELEVAAGEELGTSEWITIDQRRVNLFADATGDHQWIHVDVERAKAGPFGGTDVTRTEYAGGDFSSHWEPVPAWGAWASITRRDRAQPA